VIDLDLRSYFDTVRHHIVLEKVAARVDDDQVMHLLKLILSASGKRGVPQGGVISPLLSNLYLNAVDRMLERAKEVTRYRRRTAVEYCRFADDLVVLVDCHPRHRWLLKAVPKRLREEFGKLQVEVNEEKSRQVDLMRRESFAFGHSSRCFSFIRDYVAKKIRRHLARARQRQGFGWKRWSEKWLVQTFGLFSGYRVNYQPASRVVPA
jgi:hypothetical protein